MSELLMAASSGVVTLLKVSWLRISRFLRDILVKTLNLVFPDWAMAAFKVSLTIWAASF
jgi:hypothetical protein